MFIKSAPSSVNIINRLSIRPDVLHSYSSYNTFFDQALKNAIPHANTPEKAAQMQQSLGRNWVKDIYNGVKNAGIQDPSRLEDAIQEGYLKFAHDPESPHSFKSYATKEMAPPFLIHWLTNAKYHGLHYQNMETRNKAESLNKPLMGDEGNLEQVLDPSRVRDRSETGTGYWAENLSPEEKEKDRIIQYIREGKSLRNLAKSIRIPMERVRQHLKSLHNEGIIDIPENVFKGLEKPVRIEKTKQTLKQTPNLEEKIVDHLKRKGPRRISDIIDNYRHTATPEQVRLTIHHLIEKGIIPKEIIKKGTPGVKPSNKPLEEKILNYFSTHPSIEFNILSDFYRKSHSKEEVKSTVDKLIREGKLSPDKVRILESTKDKSIPLRERIKGYLSKNNTQIGLHRLYNMFKRTASKQEVIQAVNELIKTGDIDKGRIGTLENNPQRIKGARPLRDKIKEFISTRKEPIQSFYNLYHNYTTKGHDKEEVRRIVQELIKNKEVPEGKLAFTI